MAVKDDELNATDGAKMGERIREALRDAKLTQAKLAELSGASPRTISRYVSASGPPEIVARLASVCVALKVSPAWILLGVGPKSLEDAVRDAAEIMDERWLAAIEAQGGPDNLRRLLFVMLERLGSPQ